MNLEFIFKVIDKEEWQKAKQSGTYGGSEKDIKDGYIHFSEEDQVEETLKKYFPNKENLVLLRVNAFKLEHLLWVFEETTLKLVFLACSPDLSLS
jgi:uncharacterized protein (DUF952 family)